jgi:hypothetical protein
MASTMWESSEVAVCRSPIAACTGSKMDPVLGIQRNRRGVCYWRSQTIHRLHPELTYHVMVLVSNSFKELEL